jgi:Cation transporter/ATPase, N-terminus
VEAHGSRPRIATYWSLPADELLSRLGSRADALSAAEARARLAEYGPNELARRQRLSWLRMLYRQLQSPLLLLLFFAAAVSVLTRQWVDAGLVVAILVASVGVGASREYSAESAAAALNARIRTRTNVLRDGQTTRIAERFESSAASMHNPARRVHLPAACATSSIGRVSAGTSATARTRSRGFRPFSCSGATAIR